jgi:hypothetical protein
MSFPKKRIWNFTFKLERPGFDFVREKEHTVFYKGIDVGTRGADFVVEGQVVIE